jgi:hypothetical protein
MDKNDHVNNNGSNTNHSHGSSSATIPQPSPITADNSINQREFELNMRELAIALSKREVEVEKREATIVVAAERMEAAVEKREAAIERREAVIEKRKAAIERREAVIEKREAAIERREVVIEKREVAIERREADLAAKEAQFQAKESQFQTILDQHYFLNSTQTSLCTDQSPNGDGARDLGIEQNNDQQHSQSTPFTSESKPHQDALDMVNSADAQEVIDAKLKDIEVKGMQMKMIRKQLVIGYDNLVRQRLQLENDSKVHEDALGAEWDVIKAKEDAIQVQEDKIKAKEEQIKANEKKIKANENKIKTKQGQMKKEQAKQEEFSATVTALGPVLSTLASKPDILKDAEIIKLIGASINDPNAMAKLKAIVDFELDLDGAKKMIASPHGHLAPLYDVVISACNMNSKHYGESDSRVQIEFRCEQLSKQVHFKCYHYLNLLRFLFHTGDIKHINPHKTDMVFTCNTLTGYSWKSDYDSGKIPKFTPELKLFFKTPNIANNVWIQFHGPGTVLYDIDPSFKLTWGSLCDPNGKGSFTSIRTMDKEADPDNKWNGKTATSQYQISFKWE